MSGDLMTQEQTQATGDTGVVSGFLDTYVEPLVSWLPEDLRLAIKLVIYASALGVGAAAFIRLVFWQRPDRLKPGESQLKFDFRVAGWKRTMFKIGGAAGFLIAVPMVWDAMDDLGMMNRLFTTVGISMCAGAVTPYTFNFVKAAWLNVLVPVATGIVGWVRLKIAELLGEKKKEMKERGIEAPSTGATEVLGRKREKDDGAG